MDRIISKDTVFVREELIPGRDPEFANGLHARNAIPEDFCLKKEAAFRPGRLEKHISDFLSILSISGRLPDQAYLEHWNARLCFQGIGRNIQNEHRRQSLTDKQVIRWRNHRRERPGFPRV